MSQNFFGSHYTCGKVRKKIFGQKVNVRFFRLNPYMLGNRIPRAFQNLSDLHVRCHREKFYNGFLSQNLFESHYTCVGVRKKCWGKKSMKKIKFQVRPRKKNHKREKILFSGRLCFEKLKQYFGGLAIFHNPLVCEGLWKIAKSPKFGFCSSKQSLLEIFLTQLFSTEPVVHLRVVQLSRNFGSKP